MVRVKKLGNCMDYPTAPKPVKVENNLYSRFSSFSSMLKICKDMGLIKFVILISNFYIVNSNRGSFRNKTCLSMEPIPASLDVCETSYLANKYLFTELSFRKFACFNTQR